MTDMKAGISNQPSATENLETVSSSESEERFRLLLEASPDGYIILRSVRDAAGKIADFQIEYTNPVAARGVNRTPAELLGQRLLQLFPDCQTSGIFARYVTVAETGISTTFETFYDSKELAGWFRNVVVKLNDGIAVSFSNITEHKQEQKQFEESLRVANQRIYNILESITDAFVAFDCNWCYTYVNQEAARLLGRSPTELLGQRWQDAFPEAQQNSVIVQQFERAIAEQKTVRFEAFSLSVNRWLDISLFPSPEGLAMYFQDISEQQAALRDRKRAEQRRDIQYAITRILAEAKTVAQATPAILQALCENLGWQVGELWQIDSLSPVLRCINYWQDPNVDIREFVAAAQQITFAPGVGLPGRVWASRQPHWICELSQDSNFPRTTHASRVGLRSGFGFPILLGDEILGVIECFSQRVQEPDQDLLEMMAAIGSQIGQFMERQRTEIALRESQELFQSFMNNSPVAAFIKDESGRYLFANSWVEQIFGRSQSDLIGKTDFELLPQALAQQCYTNDLTVLTSGKPMQTLETMQREDGEHSYMTFKFPLRNAAGQKLLAGVSLDVSDRVRAEEELRQREAELRLLTNAVPVLISFVDTEQRYRFNNQKYEEWFGKPATAMNGKYLWEVLGEVGYERIRPYVEQVLAGNEVTFETRIAYKQGDIRDGIVNYVPRFDGQGNVVGFVALVNDITYRKQAEETLRQSEERLRIAQQAANAGVWDWNIATNQVTWSEEYYCLYGLDRATTQPSYENWLLSIIEEDRDRADQVARKALANCTDLNVEFRILHPKRGERWLMAIGQTFYDDNGQPQRMTGIALDITARKCAEAALQKSEERYRRIYDQVIVGISQTDLTGRFIAANERFCEIVGRSSAELLTLRMQDITHPDDLPNNLVLFQRMLAEGTSFEVEKRYIRPDGSHVWVRNYVSVIRDAAGQPQHAVAVAEDITERKQAELALAKSNQTLQAIVQACPLAIMGLRSDGIVKIWNPAAQRIFGWSQEEVLDKFLPAIPQDKWQEFLNNLAATMQGQALAGVETQRQKKGNLPIDVALWSAPVDEAQTGISCLSIVADITERKRAEVDLFRLAAIVESSEDAIISKTLNGVIISWNTGAEKLFGYSAPEAIGKSITLLVPADRLDEEAQILEKLRQGERVEHFETVRKRRDGTLIDISLTISPVKDATGKIIGISKIARDISHRKQTEQALCQSEERYRYLAESIPQLVWTANTEGVLIDINQRWSDFTGLTLAQARTGGWQAVVHPDDVPILSQKWAIAQQNGSHYQAQGRMRRADGVYRWHLHQAVPLKNAQGQVIKWFGTATDIEDQKQLEQQRIHLLQQEQAAREQAETANRIKDEFLAVLSHELRSPLNPILGWSRLMQTAKLDEAKTKQALATIERNAQLQAELIEDLLDVSRILQGKLSLTSSPINLASTMKAALETVRLAAEAKSIHIEADLDTEIGTVLGDSTRLQQVMWNLLSNAVKFTPAGGRVEVRLQQVENQAQITVSDTGKGIAPDFLPYVFDYFRQADSTTTRKFGGLGLGLAIVRHLVDLHGGTIQAQSQGEGMGATFTVKLPLMPNQPSVNADSPLSEASLSLQGIKILVVDDDTDTREFVAFLLSQAGATVSTAASALEALKILTQSQLDILLSDIGMPEMDGYMLMRRVRALPPEQGGKIRAIALTAYAGEIDEKQALNVGFQKHITKPVEPDNLIRAIINLTSISVEDSRYTNFGF